MWTEYGSEYTVLCTKFQTKWRSKKEAMGKRHLWYFSLRQTLNIADDPSSTPLRDNKTAIRFIICRTKHGNALSMFTSATNNGFHIHTICLKITHENGQQSGIWYLGNPSSTTKGFTVCSGFGACGPTMSSKIFGIIRLHQGPLLLAEVS